MKTTVATRRRPIVIVRMTYNANVCSNAKSVRSQQRRTRRSIRPRPRWLCPLYPVEISSNSILAVAPGPPIEEKVVVPMEEKDVAPVEELVTTMEEPDAPIVAEESEPPVTEPPLDPESLLNEYCGMCMGKYKWGRRKDMENGLTCACCQRVGLPDKYFSKNQKAKGPSEQRCKTCSQGGSDILDLIRLEDPAQRNAVITRNLQRLVAKQQALEKRRETMAKRKREKQQQEEEGAKKLASNEPIEMDEDDASDHSDDSDEIAVRMEKQVRDILTANRSIQRRREVVDLDGPDREAYLLQLLNEETKLHEQAAALCLQNAEVYDRVCEKLLVIDGKVKIGERDHEQGDLMATNQIIRLQKAGKPELSRRKQTILLPRMLCCYGQPKLLLSSDDRNCLLKNHHQNESNASTKTAMHGWSSIVPVEILRNQ